jgi:arginyl-tRNA synthetase
MNCIEKIQQAFAEYLQHTFSIEQTAASSCRFVVNVDENKQQFGDLNSNAPMVIAKKTGRNPRDVATHIIEEFKHPLIERLEIAGPGFLNATLQIETIKNLADELYTQQAEFFKLSTHVKKHNYSIEFVSANPTGPLHFGHGRGGIIGDVLGNILRFIGHSVTKEFYINDAGSQMNKLGMSLKIRYLQALGQQAELPEDAYHGEYLIDLAKQCIQEHGTSLQDKPEQFFIDYGYKHLLARLQNTLQKYGIHFDVWFSEKTLHSSGAIEKALEVLQNHGYIYEQEGAIWFKATAFGDDKDRVVRKTDGEYTYAAADIAYLLNKANRKFDKLVMVLGHDHHSYAVRLEALRQALQLTCSLDVILYQLVRMQASGQLVRMSKRAGNIVTLDDVIETVGTDVTRFFYLNRKADAQLVFDLDLALKKTEENPVYYIQYAFVRTNSILQKAAQEKDLQNIGTADNIHLDREEALLIKKIASLKDLLESISENNQTHLLTYYVLELANLFHKYYAQNRVIDLENIDKSRARLYLIKMVNNTLQTCLTLLGISCPEKM